MEADQTVSIARTFAVVQTVALAALLVGVWAWALFMFKALREVLAAHRDLVQSVVNLKAAQQGIAPVAVQPFRHQFEQGQPVERDPEFTLENLG